MKGSRCKRAHEMQVRVAWWEVLDFRGRLRPDTGWLQVHDKKLKYVYFYLTERGTIVLREVSVVGRLEFCVKHGITHGVRLQSGSLRNQLCRRDLVGSVLRNNALHL